MHKHVLLISMTEFSFALRVLVLLNVIQIINTKKYVISHCRNENNLMSTAEESLYQLIEAEPGDTLKLACHYCNKVDNSKVKIWTKLNYLVNETSEEINFSTSKRFHLQKDNSLLIKTIEVNDSGLYTCQEMTKLDDTYSDVDNKYIYYIDVVVVELYHQGNTENWKAYVEKNIRPMNERFLQSQLEDYIYLRDIIGVYIRAISEWESKHTCDGCTGISKRRAFCRLRPEHKENMDIKHLNPLMKRIKQFLSLYRISCHSMQFSGIFPEIGRELSNISDYIIVSQCKGPCKVSSGSNRAKYRDSYTLKEGAYLTLTCPEATSTNQIVWRKNGVKLKARRNTNLRVEVDAFGTLSLSDVALGDEGNYSCYVDNLHMQDVIIKIKSSFSDGKEFFWENVYIGIIIWINFIFFCAGIAIKYTRRHNYKTLEEILKEEKLKKERGYDMFH